MCLSTRIAIVIIILLHIRYTITGDWWDSASPYYPIDDIAINCGSSGNSTALDGREWIGDVRSKSTPSPYPKGKSTTTRALHHQYLSADPVPYMTARISRSHFTYTFRVSAGQKFIRLHFYPSTSYIGFEASNSFFSVKAGPYTLLTNFSASLTAEALGVNFFAKEFCVNIDDNQSLSITFSPSSSSTNTKNVYAFVNGIEVVSMPTGLYYSLRGDLGASVVGDTYRFFIDNRTALEMVYRLNIGGRPILPIEDLGMYRSWSEDRNYLLQSGAVFVRTNTMIKYSDIRTYAAPMRVYQTAWSMGHKGNAYEVYNLGWKLLVDSGFRYLVRLHFCELEFEEAESGQRNFVVSINNKIPEIFDEGGIKWRGANGCPVYRDYIVTMEGDRNDGKRDLIIAHHRKPKSESRTTQNAALLNGLEIFKLSNPDNNLAGPNPGSTTRSLTSWTSKLRRFVLIVGGGNSIVAIVTFVLALINIIVYQLNRYGTNASVENKSSLYEEKSCRRFSLMEIQLATNNFDDALVVGNGGFGKVYKGSIDHGARTVAIKRLKLESKQGALEFWTEIETLSAYQHSNLVSLIGYCDEGQEMLLVYEFMAHGTLADHLHKIRIRNGNGSGHLPLSWEQRLKICTGAATGLNYLHTVRGAWHGIIHRDVKSSNILLDENWVAKISDFGLSKMNAENLSCTHISTEIKGTFGYLDPDYYRTRRLTSKSDVFAFGVVLFEVLCGRPAVDTSLVEEQHSLVLWAQQCIREGKLDQIVDTSVREQISPQCLKAFAEIANKCLCNLPNERPTMAEVMNGLEFELERCGSAYLINEEEDSNGQISPASPTSEENLRRTLSVGYARQIRPKSAKVPRMKKRENVSHRGPTWGWRWDSLWRRAKPSRVQNFPMPKVSCRSFSLTEIQEATCNFSRLVGNDPFSNVYFGYIDDMVPVAFKRLNENAIHEEFFTCMKIEFELQHVNLVPLIGHCYDQGEVVLVYDYMANGRLYDHLHNTNGSDPLSWKQRLQICIDAARGLNYLHSGTTHKIIHRKVNSHNILLDNKWVAKITNLRCSKIVIANQSITYIATPVVGTIGYLDEEYSRTGWMTEKSDVFSFGVVLFEALSGRKALEPKEEEPYLYRWVKYHGDDQIIDSYMNGIIYSGSLRVFVDIAKKCLRVREVERPSMLDVLRGLELALELQERIDALGDYGIIGLSESHIYESDEVSGGVLDDSDDWSFPR